MAARGAREGLWSEQRMCARLEIQTGRLAHTLTLTRALRARRARPPEVPEKGSVNGLKAHPYIGCTFGGIEVFRATRACAVLFLCLVQYIFYFNFRLDNGYFLAGTQNKEIILPI